MQCLLSAQPQAIDSGRIEGLSPTGALKYWQETRVNFVKPASIVTSDVLNVISSVRDTVPPDSKYQLVSLCLWPSAAVDETVCC